MAYRRKRSFRKRSYKRKYRGKSYRKKTFAARVTRVLMKRTETKHLIASQENIQLYHNLGSGGAAMNAVIFNPWQAIQQGTGASQRIGTEVYPRGLAVRLELFNKLDRPNITYRIMVGILPKMYNNAVTTAAFEWRDLNGPSNSLIAWVKPDAGIKILYDKTFRNEAHNSMIYASAGNFTNKEAHKFVKFYIKSKRGQKLLWNPAGELVNKPMVMWIIAYDSYGTLTTDNIASCAVNTKYYFKDV